MGRFVGHLGEPATRACLEVIPDEKLLPIAFVMSEALDELIRTATAQGLWEDALLLTRSLDDQTRRRFAQVPAMQEAEALRAIVAAAVEHELWQRSLPRPTTR